MKSMVIIVVDNKYRFDDLDLDQDSIKRVADRSGYDAIVEKGDPDFVFLHSGWREARSTEQYLIQQGIGALVFSGASPIGINVEELRARLASIPGIVERCKKNCYGREQIVTAVFDFVKSYSSRQRELCEKLQAVLGTITGLELLALHGREGMPDQGREEWLRILTQCVEWIQPEGKYSAVCIKRCNRERQDAHKALKFLIKTSSNEDIPRRSSITDARLKLEALVNRLRSAEAEAEIID